jgi:hypothetical protein
MRYRLKNTAAAVSAVFCLGVASTAAHGVEIFWTDWTGADLDAGSGFRAEGTITTGSTSLTVTYTNPNGISFYQASGGIDYYVNGTAETSPYTSSTVDNRPTGTDIVALRFAGQQTLQFSQAIANPVFAYVSLNGNGYAFDRDFEILSFGDPSNGNACGYWGCGTSFKSVVDVGGGSIEYRLLGTGEPHGTLRFLGSFDTVSWRSLSNENWNGFTVGVQGTAAEVFPPVVPAIPEPETYVLMLVGLGAVGVVARRRKRVTA